VGAPLAFIDPKTFANGETVTWTLDRSAGSLAMGVGMVNADPAQHGSGSVIGNNLVQEGIFSRGIWLAVFARFRGAVVRHHDPEQRRRCSDQLRKPIHRPDRDGGIHPHGRGKRSCQPGKGLRRPSYRISVTSASLKK
jgi:hypothetical protein